MLELMHFPAELVAVSEFKAPAQKTPAGKEMSMAKQLVESMSTKWEPEAYKDDYREALEKMIAEKIEHGGREVSAPARKRQATKTIDLVSVLQRSLRESQGKVRHDGRARDRRQKLAA